MIIILTYPIVITCKRPGHVLEILRGIMEAVWGVGATGPETVTGIGAPLCRDRQRAPGATSSGPFCADSSGQHRCRIGLEAEAALSHGPRAAYQPSYAQPHLRVY
jgi:hypothetical protein